MGRIRRILCALLILPLSCESEEEPEIVQTTIILELPSTRSADPDQYRISDYNLWIFHPNGTLEERRYVSPRELASLGGEAKYRTKLLKGIPYRIYACANLGYELRIDNEAELKAYRYHLAYPDEYSTGLPMASVLEKACVENDGETLGLALERLLAKVELSIDRSALDADVSFTVREVSVGGCPSSVTPFSPSKAEHSGQIFNNGFIKNGMQTSPLNREVQVGKSESICVYLLENLQGDLLENVVSDQGKVFSDSRLAEICSYIRIKAEYSSPDYRTKPGEYLVYRFYLGENRNNFDVRRNTHYTVSIRPEGDGLNEDSWRVDKSGIEPQTRFELHPAAFNTCSSSEDYHIWCDIAPSWTPVEIEPLAYDDDIRVEELYDYQIDPDGHGLVIHPHKGGTAMVYIKAGHPVNRDTLAMLVVDP